MTSQAFQLRPIDGRGGHAAFWLIFAAAIKGLSALMFAFIIVLLANVQNLSREFVGVWDVIPTLSALIVVGFLVPMLFVALWIHRGQRSIAFEWVWNLSRPGGRLVLRACREPVHAACCDGRDLAH